MDYKYIGEGAYSLSEAARIIHANPQRIKRWMRGYDYKRRTGEYRSRPPVLSDVGEDINGFLTLDFQDLIEVWFVDRFLGAGVSIRTVRRAAEKAQQLLSTSHPFSSQRFLTDGKSILARIQEETQDAELFDLLSDQLEWESVLAPFLRSLLEFDADDRPVRYWPLGRDRLVVLDRERAFGAPIVTPSGVRTAVLSASFEAQGSSEAVATWYRVGVDEVRDAIEYERQLAA